MPFLFILLLSICLAPAESTEPTLRKFRAHQVFDLKKPLIFQDDFAGAPFDKWAFSEDNRYRLPRANPDYLTIVDAPGMDEGKKAARFVVKRGPNSFRSEISLPSEKGFNERWYGARILVPDEWVFDPENANDIVIQWHGIPGNGKSTYPNLAISIQDNNWWVKQSFGATRPKPTRTKDLLGDKVKRGVWVSWVIHARWSPRPDGSLRIWKDDKLVIDKKGPNLYSDIGVEYTPYLKTGIYHPEWHLNTERKQKAFVAAKVPTKKIIYVTDLKVGSEKATKDLVTP